VLQFNASSQRGQSNVVFVLSIRKLHAVFMQGGPSWERVANFYKCMYGCNSFDDSSQRIVEAIQEAPRDTATILVAHNGPAGLGTNPWDICGKDFTKRGESGPPQGDHGDPDLRDALAAAATAGRCLVRLSLACVPRLPLQVAVNGYTQSYLLNWENAAVVLKSRLVFVAPSGTPGFAALCPTHQAQW
jgi:hypothetical protein